MAKPGLLSINSANNENVYCVNFQAALDFLKLIYEISLALFSIGLKLVFLSHLFMHRFYNKLYTEALKGCQTVPVNQAVWWSCNTSLSHNLYFKIFFFSHYLSTTCIYILYNSTYSITLQCVSHAYIHVGFALKCSCWNVLFTFLSLSWVVRILPPNVYGALLIILFCLFRPLYVTVC